MGPGRPARIGGNEPSCRPSGRSRDGLTMNNSSTSWQVMFRACRPSTCDWRVHRHCPSRSSRPRPREGQGPPPRRCRSKLSTAGGAPPARAVCNHAADLSVVLNGSEIYPTHARPITVRFADTRRLEINQVVERRQRRIGRSRFRATWRCDPQSATRRAPSPTQRASIISSCSLATAAASGSTLSDNAR